MTPVVMRIQKGAVEARRDREQFLDGRARGLRDVEEKVPLAEVACDGVLARLTRSWRVVHDEEDGAGRTHINTALYGEMAAAPRSEGGDGRQKRGYKQQTKPNLRERAETHARETFEAFFCVLSIAAGGI